jgi:hypothetical protein
VAILFEAGPVAFLTRTGPFAWDGLLVFWIPLTLVIGWISIMAALLLRAIGAQDGLPDRGPGAGDGNRTRTISLED